MTTKMTVAELAKQLGLSPDTLLEQFKLANMRIKSADQEVSDGQQQKITEWVMQNDLTSSKKTDATDASKTTKSSSKKTLGLKSASSAAGTLGLRRKTVSKLKVTGIQSGSTKTVNVEVRRKHTYIKRGLLQKEKEREEERRREEELKRQEKLQAEQKLKEQEQKSIEETSKKPSKEEPVVAAKPSVKGEEVPERFQGADLEEADKRRAMKKAKAKQVEKKRSQKRIDWRNIKLDDDDVDALDQTPRRKFFREAKAKVPVARQMFERPTEPVVREISLPETITVADLAQKMSVKAVEVVKKLMSLGVMATVNQVIDRDTAILIVEEMGHTPKIINENAIEEMLREELKSDAPALPRAPVVTIMGHVDHGKTSLLDYIRSSKVTEGEAGGITQHIGAYHVETPKGMITFLDTPGHEAFTAMRARGAKVTDIVVLIVAADDGVMPQTIEAIEHSKAAEVPIIVAINKMDKPAADPDRVKTELSQHGVISEDWGGDCMIIPISAKTGMGVDDLLDAILLQAEVLELKAVRDAPARGFVLESRLDKGRGVVTSVLVQAGTLRQGDIILAGMDYGRVRAIFDERAQRIEEAGPSMPAEVLGLPVAPNAGDEIVVVKDEQRAREVALFRQAAFKQAKFASTEKVTLDNLFDHLEKGEPGILNLVIKAGVQGSVEALKEALQKLSTDEVQVKIISSGVGAITESDVNLAIASRAIIIGFNVRATHVTKRLIEKTGVDVRYHSIIYEVIDEVKKALQGLLSPEIKEKIIGLAVVRDVFRSPKFGAIAGCMVQEGLVKRNRPIRVLRDSVVIFEGELDSLRRGKDDVSEVRQGVECGIGVTNYNDIKVGDQIEVFERVEVARTL